MWTDRGDEKQLIDTKRETVSAFYTGNVVLNDLLRGIDVQSTDVWIYLYQIFSLQKLAIVCTMCPFRRCQGF